MHISALARPRLARKNIIYLLFLCFKVSFLFSFIPFVRHPLGDSPRLPHGDKGKHVRGSDDAAIILNL